MIHFRLVVVLWVLGATWGLTIPLTKIAVSTGHAPPGLIFWQLLIVTLVLSAISLFRRVRPVFSRPMLGYFLIIGLLGTVLPNNFWYLAAAQLPAGVMGIVIASVPMFSLGIALGIGAENLSVHRSLGVLLGAGAVVLLIAPQAGLPEPDKWMYVLVALIAPFCYGAGRQLYSNPGTRSR